MAYTPCRVLEGEQSSRQRLPADYSGSMSAWDNGPITYHLKIFGGHMFEIYERLAIANDGTKLTLTQRVVGPSGAEQELRADLPVAKIR